MSGIKSMAWGLALLFIRPLVLLLAPEKPPKTIRPVPAFAPTSPLITAQAANLQQPEPEPETISPKTTTTPAQPDLPVLKAAYLALQELPAKQRGFAFQRFLYDLFTAHGLDTRTAFRITGEEIDGSFELGSAWCSTFTPWTTPKDFPTELRTM